MVYVRVYPSFLLLSALFFVSAFSPISTVFARAFAEFEPLPPGQYGPPIPRAFKKHHRKPAAASNATTKKYDVSGFIEEDAEFHTATSIETASDIASSERMRDLYPELKLYGSGGRLQLLLQMNPWLRNGTVRAGKKVLLARSLKALGAKSKEEFNLGKQINEQGKVGLSKEEIESIKLKISNLQFYTAVKGDMMAALALKFFAGKKLYGPGGRLELLLKLNPHIENQNAIYPGDIILIDPNGELREELDRRSAEQMAALIPSRKEFEKLEKPPDDRPEPDRKPSSEAVEKAALDDYFSWLRIEPTASFYRLDVTDLSSLSTGTVISNLSPGFKFAWEPQIGKEIYASLGIQWNQIGWISPSGRTLSENQSSLLGFHAEIGKRFSRRLRISLIGGQSETPVLRARTTQILSIEKVSIPTVGGEMGVGIFSAGPFNGEVVLGGGTSLSSQSGTLTVNQGIYYNYGFQIDQTTRSTKIRGGIFLKNESFDTNFSRNSYQEMEFRLGVSFKLGD